VYLVSVYGTDKYEWLPLLFFRGQTGTRVG
jgi:hypothetical protein